MELIVLGGAVLIAIVIVVVGIISARSEENMIEERLGRFEQTDSFQPLLDIEAEEEPSFVDERRKIIETFDNILAERKFGKKWRRQLARADLKLTVSEFFGIHIVTTIGGFAAAGGTF